jgi:hypothetical protein
MLHHARAGNIPQLVVEEDEGVRGAGTVGGVKVGVGICIVSWTCRACCGYTLKVRAPRWVVAF